MRSRNSFVIGTRGSALALKQAEYIAALVRNLRPQLEVEIQVVKTTGDKILDVALSKFDSKGLFTKELEIKLLDEEIDCCVHSMKDVPSLLPEGLEIACIPLREDVRDVLVSYNHEAQSIMELKEGARVGTGSLRRRAQLRALRPDLNLVELRGNLDTRLAKVEQGELDAAILAAAGIRRMGWTSRISAYLDLDEMLPAVGQAAIGVEIKSQDLFSATILEQFNHKSSFRSVMAERIVMKELEGGCQAPLAVFARVLPDDKTMRIDAKVLSLDGKQVLRSEISGNKKEYEQLAYTVVDELRTQGVSKLLQEQRDILSRQSQGQVIF